MESENNNFVKKSHLEEVNLAAYRRRYSKLILIFKLFFISLTLIMGALITYLVQSESSDQSIHQNPSVQISNHPIIITIQSEIFNLSLQRAAQELENATSLILSNYSASDKDAKTELAIAFSNCRKWLQNGSAQLREAIRANPFPRRLSNERRVEMANRIDAAEKNMNSCLDDLAMVEPSAAANEVRERVFEAAAFLSERGDFLMSHRDEMLRKFWKTVDAVWAVILENLVVICLYGLQMMFIFFLFWTIFKFR